MVSTYQQGVLSLIPCLVLSSQRSVSICMHIGGPRVQTEFEFLKTDSSNCKSVGIDNFFTKYRVQIESNCS